MSEQKKRVVKRKGKRKFVIRTKSSTNLSDVEKYKKSLDDDSRKAMKIAERLLETSFDIEKSIGYKKWLQDNKK